MAEDKLPALEEIRERADAASPGPWEADVEHGYDMDDEPFTFDVVTGPDGQMALETLADLRFAAHARTDVPRLLAVVDKVLELTAAPTEEHRDLDGNLEGTVTRMVRCDVLREAITRALTGEENDGG